MENSSSRALHCIALFVIFISGTFPVRAASPPPGKRLLVFVGSNTLGEHAVPELAKAYLEQEKKATDAKIEARGELIHVTATVPGEGPVFIEIHATGSGDSFKSFLGQFPRLAGPCDIGMSSRRVTRAEAEALKEKLGSDFFWRGNEPGTGCEHPVAMDGLAIVTHESNPLGRISFSEIKAIYSRRKTSWNDLAEWKTFGGAEPGPPIIPLRRKEPSGTLDFFKQMIRPEAMADEKQVPAFVSSRELAKRVSELPGAIGFIGESYATQPGIKRLQVFDDSPGMEMEPDAAVFPDRAAVRMGIYPLSRIVYLYTREFSDNPEMQPFVRFVLGEAGQAIIADKGNLVKIEGTHDHITQLGTPREAEPVAPAVPANRKTRVVLRVSGSNTVGAVCAVNLAFNYFSIVTRDAKKPAPIEDHTTELDTPEGEKALAHDVMCDVDSDGIWETISIRPTGSSDAFRDLNLGACDVGMSSRPISGTEQRDLMAVCGNLAQPGSQFALGLDALAIITGKDNVVEKITVDQIRRVFLGEISNWSELGGLDRPIVLHARPERSGTYKYFSDSVLNGRSISGLAKRHAENSTLAEIVAKDPDGIGFVPMTNATASRVLKVGHSESSPYFAPTEESVRRGQYPAALCRYIYFYVPQEEPQGASVQARRNWPIAREFAAMSQTWRGQAVVESSGFVVETTLADSAAKILREDGESITSYLNRLRDIERKVVSGQLKLRPLLTDDEICPMLLFEFNQWTLTPESVNIIDRKLASWLKMYPDIARAGLITEGWADSVGSDEACLKVSLERARTAAEYIQSSLGVKVSPAGKGKSFDPPNNSEENKQRNRRVVIKRASDTITPGP
jgi:ABC-type phosphate transport system substrate-binding protein